MLLSIPNQMMDTCYSENRMKIYRSYLEKKMIGIYQILSKIDLYIEILFPSQYCMQ